MTTYKSTAVSLDESLSLMPVGEITYPDGYRILVPQPVRFEAVPARMCMSCLRTIQCADDCADRGILDDRPVEGVVERSEMAAESRPAVPRVPVWSLVSIVAGMVLVAIGLVLRDPVARAVWETLNG